MRRLHRKVNIVPVIAKADTLTAAEIKKLKERVMADIEDHKIQVRIKWKKKSKLFLASSMRTIPKFETSQRGSV